MAFEGMLIARGERDLLLLPKMANRQGLVAGVSQLGRSILRGVPGSILGGGSRR